MSRPPILGQALTSILNDPRHTRGDRRAVEAAAVCINTKPRTDLRDVSIDDFKSYITLTSSSSTEKKRRHNSSFHEKTKVDATTTPAASEFASLNTIPAWFTSPDFAVNSKEEFDYYFMAHISQQLPRWLDAVELDLIAQLSLRTDAFLGALDTLKVTC
jgi:hypothetical protein